MPDLHLYKFRTGHIGGNKIIYLGITYLTPSILHQKEPKPESAILSPACLYIRIPHNRLQYGISLFHHRGNCEQVRHIHRIQNILSKIQSIFR